MKKKCPYCLGEFRGANGLSIHLARSVACSDRQVNDFSAQEHVTNETANAFSQLQDIARNGSDITNFSIPDEAVEDGMTIVEDDITNTNFSNYVNSLSQSDLPAVTSQQPEFNTTLELVYLLLTSNNGNGLSINDQNKWIRFLLDPRVKLSDIKVRNAADVEKFLADFEKTVFGEDVRLQLMSFSFSRFIFLHFTILYKFSP